MTSTATLSVRADTSDLAPVTTVTSHSLGPVDPSVTLLYFGTVVLVNFVFQSIKYNSNNLYFRCNKLIAASRGLMSVVEVFPVYLEIIVVTRINQGNALSSLVLFQETPEIHYYCRQKQLLLNEMIKPDIWTSLAIIRLLIPASIRRYEGHWSLQMVTKVE